MIEKPGQQLVFSLDHRPAYGRDDFLVSACNADAVDWIDRWPNWPPVVTGLNLVGPPSSGKSHLAASWRLRSGATWMDHPPDSFTTALNALGPASNVVLDGFDETWPGEPVFHIYNLVTERAGKLVLCTTVPVARMACEPPDLASRLATIASVTIGRPDDALLAGVLSKLFFDRQMQVGENVLQYLVQRMERSFEEAAGLVSMLDEASLAKRRAVTLPLVREILAAREVGSERMGVN